MRPGIAVILIFLLFSALAFGKAGNSYALKRAAIPQDTIKKDRPKKTNACTAIGNLTGNICIGSTLSATVNTQLTDPIASVEWFNGNNTSLLMQNAAPFEYTPPVAATYFVRIITKAGCTVNSNSVTISNLKLPLINISTPSRIICADFPNPSFTGVPTFNGDKATYQWKVNHVNVGPLVMDVGQAFVPTGLKKGDVVSCEMTSTDACITTPIVQSNEIVIDDIPTENPSVSIVLNTATPCAGSDLMFTANPVNSGDAPGYQWYLNNTAVPNATGKTFISNQLKNSDRVTCTVQSNAKFCQVSTTASSQPFTVALIPAVTPEISIASVTYEVDISITYAATIKNGGPEPLYQWQINGVDAGSTSDTFVATKLVPGDVITCTLISNADCTTTNRVVSDPVTNNATIPTKLLTANLFTPNGDGINDTWAFPGVNAFSYSANVRVYNRNGKQMFHSTGYVVEWDGKTDAGKPCPAGVYYYLVTLDNKQTMSGSITILR